MKLFTVLVTIYLCQKASACLEKCDIPSKNLIKPLLEIANTGWAHFVKAFNLKSIPITYIKKDIQNFLSIGISEGALLGFPNIQFENIYVNFDNNTAEIIYKQPLLNINGKYFMQGSFLGFPLNDHGHLNLTYTSGRYTYHADFEVQEKLGIKYIDIKNFKLVMEIEKLIIQCDSATSPERGVILSLLFNSNWRILHKFIEKAMNEIISETYTPIIRTFLKQTPLNLFFQ